MTNYYKVYLKSTKGYQKVIAKNKAEVIKILNQANKEGFMSYLIIKRIKPSTDVPIARGNFSKKCKVVFVEDIEKPYEIKAVELVIDEKGKYNRAKEKEKVRKMSERYVDK